MKIFDYPPLVRTVPITEEMLKELNEMSEYVKELREKNKITFPTKFTDKDGNVHETTVTLRPLF
jgi:hypothetical protein